MIIGHGHGARHGSWLFFALGGLVPRTWCLISAVYIYIVYLTLIDSYVDFPVENLGQIDSQNLGQIDLRAI